jgi:hypothetical protein
MRKIKILLAGAILMLGLFSCVKDIEFKGEQSEPMIVVNGVQQVGMPSRLCVEKSQFFMDIGNDYRLKDVSVELYVNGSFKESLQVRDSLIDEVYLVWNEEEQEEHEETRLDYAFNYCEGQYVLCAGDQVRYVVSCDGFDTATVELTMPEAPNVVSFDTVSVDSYNNVISFALVLDDPAGKDFYNLYPHGALSGFTSSDPVFSELLSFNVEELVGENNDYYGYGYYNVFNDTYFNGKRYTVSMTKSVWGLENSEPFILEVSRADESLYRYKKTYESYQEIDPNGLIGMFTEPVQVYSNVQNGAGIVAAQSQPVVMVVDLRGEE